MGTLAIHFDENSSMVQAGNVNMFFIDGGDKYRLLLLTVLKVVIKGGCQGDHGKNETFATICDEKPTLV